MRARVVVGFVVVLGCGALALTALGSGLVPGSTRTKRYNGPASGDDIPGQQVLSPDGSRLFLTGRSPGRASAPT
jgi:hypothetical protein